MNRGNALRNGMAEQLICGLLIFLVYGGRFSPKLSKLVSEPNFEAECLQCCVGLHMFGPVRQVNIKFATQATFSSQTIHVYTRYCALLIYNAYYLY